MMKSLLAMVGIVLMMSPFFVDVVNDQPAGATSTTNAVSTFERTIDPIEMPDTGHAGEPTLTHNPDGHLVASWVERHGDEARLMMATRTSGAWEEPVLLASGSNWFVNWADVPSVVFHPNGSALAYWLERLGDARYAYGVRYIASEDGVSWTDPAWLHEDRSPTEHGFVKAVPYENGFMAVWLDGNGYATERREMSVHARTIASDGSLGSERVVDTRTCDCCPTELIDLGDGRLATIYRDRSDEEIRDMSIAVFDGEAWSDPVTMHEDGWQINACPVNGPSAAAAGGQIAASWFTMTTGSPEVFAGFLNPESLTADSAVRMDLGRPAGRVALQLVSPEEALVLWMEGGDAEKAGLYVRSLSADGNLSEAIKLADTSTGRSVGYPRLARDNGEWIAVWTEPAAEEGEPARLRGVRFTL